MRVCVVLLLATAVLAPAQDNPNLTFGTTVASSAGLRGDVYLLKDDAVELPNFKRLRPVGSVYTTSLNIPARSFTTGFPGITDRFEWFAIDYNGRIWVDQAGRYQFRLLSDDGSKLWVDDALLIDNDGLHSALTVEGSAQLSRGVHRIRLAYFQGPRAEVALVLSMAGPDKDNWRIFDTNDFQPPPDPKDWVDGTVRQVKRGANW